MSIKTRKIDGAILLLFVVSLLQYLIPVFLSKGVITAPDEANYILTAENLLQHRSFAIKNIYSSYNERYNTGAFSFQHLNYIPKVGMVEQYPPGMAILLAFMSIVLFGNMFYVVPVIGALGVVLFYYFVKDLFGERHALYSAILLIVLPCYWHWSVLVYSDIPSLVCFIAALMLLGRAFKTDKAILYTLCGALFGFWIWLKYANVIMLPAVLVYIWLNKDWIRKKRNLLICFSAFAIFVIGLMLYHYWSYGNVFTIGYHYSSSAVGAGAGDLSGYPVVKTDVFSKVLSVIPFNPKVLAKHMINFPLQSSLAIPYIMLSIVSLIVMFKRDRNFCTLIFLVLAILVGFYGNAGTFGRDVEEMTLRSSYLRYLMPGFALLLIPTSLLIEKISTKRMEQNMLIGLLVIASLTVNLSSVPQSNLRKAITRDLPRMRNEKEVLLRLTGEGSVLMSKFKPKYLLPDRIPLYYEIMSLSETRRVSGLLLKDGVKVYFIADSSNEDKIRGFLSATEHTLLDEEIKLYRIHSVLIDSS